MDTTCIQIFRNVLLVKMKDEKRKNTGSNECCIRVYINIYYI